MWSIRCCGSCRRLFVFSLRVNSQSPILATPATCHCCAVYHEEACLAIEVYGLLMLTATRTLVLAPHPDDAAFSLGGLILGRRLPGPIAIITLFGRSNYARGRFHDHSAAVTALRRAEDEAWARDAGASLVWLDAPEAALRLGSTFQTVFGPADHGHEAVIRVAESLKACIEAASPSLMFAPLGIGGHCDHVVTRVLAKGIARDRNMFTAFYEDLPYAYEASAQEITAATTDALAEPFPVLASFHPGELDAKCQSLSTYATQLDESVTDAVQGHGLALNAIDGGERLWIEAADRSTADFFT